MKKKISICMIVKNEDANLKRCLDSFLPIIHEKWCELIIVDTGSKDKTLKVAREYTKNVFKKTFRPWDFSKARNYAMSKAIGDKIMTVDADEELDQKSLYILEDIICNPKVTEQTVFIRLISYYTRDRLQFSETVQARIFKRETFHYEGAIHNKPLSNPPYLFATNVTFNHYGYMFEGKEDVLKRKRKRSLPILERKYKENPDDLHISTHLIKTYKLIGEGDKIIEVGERWMKNISKVGYHEGWTAYLESFVYIAGAYIIKNDIKNAERVAKEVRKYSDKVFSIDIMIGNYYADKNPKKARKYFERVALGAKENGSPYEHLLTSNVKIIIPEILNFLAITYFEEGNYERAGECLNEGVILNENRLPIRWDVFNEPNAKKRLI